MRLDTFLKISRLIRSRSLAKEFTKAGLVEVNGKAAKSSYTVCTGDIVAINRRNSRSEIRVLNIPQKKQVSKKDANTLYEVLAHRVSDSLTD